ncbi:MAG: hypothetical protein K5785_08370 [Nitrosarchaeum sp.]|nr:hypothetical protein [Nitrosarchaeum sp.]
MNQRHAAILIFLVLLTPIISSADAAKPMDIKAQNPRVTEHEFYNTIAVDIHISIPDIEINDWITILPLDFTIVNEEGKAYYHSKDCGPQLYYEMRGKTGPNGSFTVCYDVEKKYNQFKMYYKKNLLGNIDLAEITAASPDTIKQNTNSDGQSCIRMMTQEEKDANPDRIQDGIQGVMIDGKCVTEDKSTNLSIQNSADGVKSENKSQDTGIGLFFSQLMDMIRSLFRF